MRQAAERRLQALVHPSIAALGELVEHADTDSVRLSAAKSVLEFCGFKTPERVQIDIRAASELLAQQFGMDSRELLEEADRIARTAWHQ